MQDPRDQGPSEGLELRVAMMPLVSVVVPFWGYLLGSLICNYLSIKQKSNKLRVLDIMVPSKVSWGDMRSSTHAHTCIEERGVCGKGSHRSVLGVSRFRVKGLGLTAYGRATGLLCLESASQNLNSDRKSHNNIQVFRVAFLPVGWLTLATHALQLYIKH